MDDRSMSAPPPSARDTRPIGTPSEPSGTGAAYLLVLEGESSWRFPLPAEGVVLVGRDDKADLKLKDESVSRRHARILVTDEGARVVDLGSQNGTSINGRQLEDARPLLSGDVLSFGAVVAVVRAKRRPMPARRALDADRLMGQLREEVERALRYGRPLTVLTLALAEQGSSEREAVEAVLGSDAGPAEAAGWLDGEHLLWLLPEVSGDPGEEGMGERVEALLSACPRARLGSATCPSDGCDAETLVAAARTAARTAAPGGFASAAEDITRVSLGERTVLVADPAMAQLYALLRRLAASELPVLVCGETGAGKENAAFAVHHWSRRASGPFVPVNCAALPEGLVESELFGHERGAFTGATTSRAGLLESAQGGTVFLDEVGELPASAQAKLLRALEVRRITRVGDTRERPIDIRVVAATHRDLEAEVAAGRFRQDLYFRLGAATVLLPPLRERPREVPMLARDFLERACVALGRGELELASGTLHALSRHTWPGNVRELRNLMDYVAAAVTGDVVEPHHLPARMSSGRTAAQAEVVEPEPEHALAPAHRPRLPLAQEIRELERRRMQEALEAAEGVQTRAAALIGMPIRTFSFKLKQLGLQPRSARRGTSPE
ncbi:sigma 54-interacting transcriptional regulator [Myxococcus llanfairpwllgwyngyllgogerychwyrndrobwllllantysiliogogogochensis]|uniref:sigma 54-interacting transcriptional regulator n=1 Tax=Myxococcus llanfairpwllgwyngyllgogerychwyrndrobwllllantysiliogogogochensis TaxID=2590453 RepID=UPI001FE5DB6D|nr:sigma 54-interacting transcriptional regulator [Myxococcus llanfairpwllgwyngyllgogerychwyrndrobwllllantysiliogogogochensis]